LLAIEIVVEKLADK